MSLGSPTFPVLRWFSLLWMLVWLPAYFRVWSWANLLHLCDVAVILSVIGIWLASRNRPGPHRRHRLHVGYAPPALGAPALHISHRASAGPALDPAQSWLRQTRPGGASRNRRNSPDRLALPAR